MIKVRFPLGITVEWDNADKTILRQVYDQTWEWDEYLSSFERVTQLAGEVDHPIGIIAELAGITHIPTNAILYGSRALRNLPLNTALSVVVTPSRLALSLLKTLQTITRYNKILIASTREEARILIRSALN